MTNRSISGKLLTIIVPCFNEEDVIGLTHEQICATFANQPFSVQVLYVDDGSRDSTPAMLEQMAATDRRVKVVFLSRNFGHQPAVTAGLKNADGDLVAVIDADLQDPPAIIMKMIDQWSAGYDVVYGLRKKRKEGLIKRAAYDLFYRIYRSIADIDAPLHAGDFSLLDRKVVDVINALPERNRFIRGLRAWAGFRQTGIEYDREARAAGEPKYTFKKLLKLAFDGIFNFSTVPLTIVFSFGLVTAAFAALAMVLLVVQRVFNISVAGTTPDDVPGFAFLALAVIFLGGAQIMAIGIVGEYVGRIYTEVKRRPSYVVGRTLGGQARPDPEVSDVVK